VSCLGWMKKDGGSARTAKRRDDLARHVPGLADSRQDDFPWMGQDEIDRPNQVLIQAAGSAG